MEHCIAQLELCLTLETLAETATVADKMNHEGLQQACVDFALQEENRWALYHACLSQCIMAPCSACKWLQSISIAVVG